MFLRPALAILLANLLAAPAWAAEPVLGTTGPGEAATLRGITVAPETTLVNGDVVDVGVGGNSLLNVGNGSQVRLSEKTTLRLERGDHRIAFQLFRGRAEFRSAEDSPLEAHVANVRIRSADGHAMAGEVAFRSPSLLKITASDGRLLISSTRASRDVYLSAGESAEMRLDAAAEVQSLGNSPTETHRRWLGVAALAAAVGLAVGIGIAKGEKGLNDQQKQSLVAVPFPPR